jgi:hypothetical protein
VVADDESSALAQLPMFVRGRAEAIAVSKVPVP